MKNKIIKNIPNALTVSRIIASIIGAGAFVAGNLPLSFVFYTYGAISDCLDGLAARKLDAFSELGRKLDPISDKIFAGSILVPGIICGNYVMIITLILESVISFINIKSHKMGFKPKTQQIGRVKTILLFPTIILGLLTTIINVLYPILLIFFAITTCLQIKSLITYNNLLNENIDKKRSRELEKNTDLELINDINYNKNEVKKLDLDHNNKFNFKFDKDSDNNSYGEITDISYEKRKKYTLKKK